jgi:hypothetical protein
MKPTNPQQIPGGTGQPLPPGQYVPQQAVPAPQAVPPPAAQVPASGTAPAAVPQVPVQQVPVQQVPVQQVPAEQAEPRHERDPKLPQQLFLISHSNLFYWWPIWVVGYTMAAMTFFGGTRAYVETPDHRVVAEFLVYPGKDMGVLFTLIFFLVILITNVSLRGISSVVVILLAIITALSLAYFQLWDTVLDAFGKLAIYMNLGFYMFFASVVFIVWAFTFFIYDRMQFWRLRPGQLTHEFIVGNAESSHDTRGMLFEKHQADLFRHWILGFGSGDLTISTTGAKPVTINIQNVLFINSKLDVIQRMIAAKPTTEREAG